MNGFNTKTALLLATVLVLAALPVGAQNMIIDDGAPITNAAEGWIDTWDVGLWTEIALTTPTGDGAASESPAIGTGAGNSAMSSATASAYPVTGQLVFRVDVPASGDVAVVMLRLHNDDGASPDPIVRLPFHNTNVLKVSYDGGTDENLDISSLAIADGDWVRMTIELDETTGFWGSIEKWDGSAWSAPVTSPVYAADTTLMPRSPYRLHPYFVANPAATFVMDYAALWEAGGSVPGDDEVRNPADLLQVSTAPVQDGVINAGEYGYQVPLTVTSANAHPVSWGAANETVDPSDCSFDAYLAWDANALYVALDVTDDAVETGDSFDDTWGTFEMLQIVLAETGSTAREAGSLADFILKPDGSVEWRNNAGGGDIAWGSANITADYGLTSNGYVLEVAFPWSDFNITLPTIEAGAQLKCLLGIADSDQEDLNVFLLSSGGPNANPFENHSDLSLITLVGSVTVPDVTGDAQASAEATITGAGLTVGTVSYAYSATVPEGSVISTTPPAGADVESGATVDLLVSDGPEPDGLPVAQTAALFLAALALCAFATLRIARNRA